MFLPLAIASAAAPPPLEAAAPALCRPGTVLHYAIVDGSVKGPEGARTFDVTLRGTEGDLVFDWAMSTGSQGSRTVRAEDRFHATAQDNHFTAGESGPHPGTTSVVFPVAVLKALAATGKAETAVDGTSAKVAFGSTGTAPAPLGGATWLLRGGRFTWEGLANAACPLIVHQDVGFTVDLTGVDTAPSAPPPAPAPAPVMDMPDIY